MQKKITITQNILKPWYNVYISWFTKPLRINDINTRKKPIKYTKRSTLIFRLNTVPVKKNPANPTTLHANQYPIEPIINLTSPRTINTHASNIIQNVAALLFKFFPPVLPLTENMLPLTSLYFKMASLFWPNKQPRRYTIFTTQKITIH